MSRPMQSPPYLEGKKAFKDGFHLKDCPYPLIERMGGRPSPKAMEFELKREHWLIGFSDAIREWKAQNERG